VRPARPVHRKRTRRTRCHCAAAPRSHQQNKNTLDKASDRWEASKADARLRTTSSDRPLADTMSDSAKSTYYDAKLRAQQTK